MVIYSTAVGPYDLDRALCRFLYGYRYKDETIEIKMIGFTKGVSIAFWFQYEDESPSKVYFEPGWRDFHEVNQYHSELSIFIQEYINSLDK